MQDPWKISAEERTKHDGQFFQLKPVGGFVTGEQAKGFFLQSGLQAQVLMQIWGLADMNADGKMDKKEFSIACHLISNKLKGLELPKALPAAIKADPMPTIGSFGAAPMPAAPAMQPMMPPMGGPMSSMGPIMGGMTSMGPMPVPSGMPSFGAAPVRMSNGGPALGTWGGPSVAGPGVGVGMTSAPVSFTSPTKSSSAAPAPVASTEWAIPHPAKLRYNQQFNLHDHSRKGFLHGVEAKSILQQTGLTMNLLAQVWGLSDIDNDGKLTNEEFCLAMHLVDLVKSGQTLPQKLPANLIPPSYRRGGVPPPGGPMGVSMGPMPVGMIPPTSPAPGIAPVQPPLPVTQQKDAFGDLLGGYNNIGGSPQKTMDADAQKEDVFKMPETFEDRRKENFDKGQAELEKRRAMLQEQLKQQEEERLAHERAEQEKRERIRQEQERKKQMELEKQLEKQRAAEHEREEQRRKAMEQREAARRELERQRQAEWERQRRDQLLSEKQREKAQVDRLKRENGERRNELEAMDGKKSELRNRIDQVRTTVTDLTKSIEGMRGSRDQKVADIQKFERTVQDLNQRINMLSQQKTKLDVQYESQSNNIDDTYKSVMHSYNNKKAAIDKHKSSLSDIEKKTAAKLEEVDTVNNEVKQINTKLQSQVTVNKQLQGSLMQKQTEWNEKKAQKQRESATSTPVNNVPAAAPAKKDKFSWLDDAFTRATPSPSQDIWAGFNNNTTASSQAPPSKSPAFSSTTTTTTASENIWANANAAFSSAFSSKAETPTSTVTPSATIQAAAAPSTDEDPWAKFDAEKAVPSDPFKSATGSSSWASTFFNGKKVTTPEVTGPPISATMLSGPSTGGGQTYKRFRALFQFEARHGDELGICAGDVVWVAVDKEGEPGWVHGTVEDGTNSGWFPQAYAEELPDDGSRPNFSAHTPNVFTFPDATVTASTTDAAPSAPIENVYGNMPAGGFAAAETAAAATIAAPQETEPHPADGEEDNIYENINDIVADQSSTAAGQIPNSLSTSGSSSFTAVTGASPTPGQGSAAPEGLKVQATLLWRAKRDNHLSFDKGDIITVHEQQDNWWSGELNGKVGWFPKSFVKVVGDSVATKQDSPSPVGNGMSSVPALEVSAASPPETSGSVPPSPGPDSGDQYIALYNYTSSEPNDLNFTQGETITVTKQDAEWWSGIIGDRQGMFPGNYVKKAERVNKRHSIATFPSLSAIPEDRNATYSNLPLSGENRSYSMQSLTLNRLQHGGPKASNKNREIASVLAVYQASGPEQLSLSPGQLIMIRKKSASGWWEGELQARGQKRKIGWFPANYVKLLSSGSRGTPSENKSLSPTAQLGDGGSRSATPISYPHPTSAPSLEQVVANFPYTAQNGDELTFTKSAVISVLNKDDAAWWKGELDGCTGMFPANYVSALTPTAGGANGAASPAPGSYASESKRQSAIIELIQTEETYLNDLKLVYEVYHKPITAQNILNNEEMQAVFVNWRELMVCNKKLLMALKVRRKMCRGQNISSIGDILCENLPHLSPYIRFCSCQLNATNKLHECLEKDPKFKELHKQCNGDPRVMGLPLSTYFMKPMQRVTRYPMLIEKILKYTSPDHPDHTSLSEAHRAATELCGQVNEGVREKENSDKLEWIQTHVTCDGLPEKITFNSVTNCLGPRKYLYSGSLYKQKSGKELTGFLFNDFLLLAVPQRPLGQMADVFSFDMKANVPFKMYRNPIFLNETLVKKPSGADSQDSCVFTINHTDKDYTLRAISSAERDIWVKKIDATGKFYRETERKRKEKAHSAHHKLRSYGMGRLLVVIVEGTGLVPGNETGKSDPYCEVSMGVQEHKTKVINNTLNPKWNHSMQFTIKDVHEDVLCITVYDRDLFSPNDFLGRTEIRIKDIHEETRQDKKGPLMKRLKLYEVESGEVVVKLDLQIFEQLL